jgi:hypothetical protein
MGALEEKIKVKIKESLGDILSEEDLKKIIADSLYEVFFTPKLKSENWGRKEFGEPLIVEIVGSLLVEQVKTDILIWLQENQTKVEEVISDIVKKGMCRIIAAQIDSLMQGALFTFGEQLKQQLIVK